MLFKHMYLNQSFSLKEMQIPLLCREFIEKTDAIEKVKQESAYMYVPYMSQRFL